jgi:hypothetical protein
MNDALAVCRIQGVGDLDRMTMNDWPSFFPIS